MSWKTTIAGVLASLGQALQTQTGNAFAAGQILSAISLLLLGYHAADK